MPLPGFPLANGHFYLFLSPHTLLRAACEKCQTGARNSLPLLGELATLDLDEPWNHVLLNTEATRFA